MNIHEYQGKEILRAAGVAVPASKVAFAPEEAKANAEEIGGDLWVVKAQIHAGGRGKGGGVKLAKSADEVKKLAREMIGMNLVTHQTGPEGKAVKKVLVEAGSKIKKEYYLGVLVDRSTRKIVMMASSEGGMEIEKVAAETPEKIHKAYVSPSTGFLPSHGRFLAYSMGMQGDVVKKAVKFMSGLYRVFVSNDCSLAEINPLVETKEGDVIALDIKLNFDDNALFRHKDIVELRDFDEEDPNETEASKFDLSYIALNGNIGCMVNGAGLAMSTMDIIKLHGGEPANFLDVGGSASEEKVTAAFKIILSDPNVKAILVNIFGGIMKCDIIAEGVVAAAKELSVKVPLVVRLNGTNVERGQEILEKSGLKIITASTLAEGAKKAVEASRN